MKDHNDEQNWYLLLDSQNTPLAKGYLESPPDAPSMQIRVPREKIRDILRHEDIQLVGCGEDAPILLGRIIMYRKDILFLDRLKTLGAEIRQNLRMPVSFETFLYPLTGKWRGRYTAVSNDLSCGGISFFSNAPLEDREQLEIVIPITSSPLVLKCEILRQRLSGGNTPLYAAKFVELCDEEERMVREAVFNVQLSTRAAAK